jgi:hypothetical protein
MQCPICAKYDQDESWHKDKGISQQPLDQANAKLSKQPQQCTYMIKEMSMMLQAIQGLPTHPEMGKRNFQFTMKTEPIRPVKCFTACQSLNLLLLLMILVLM